MAYMKPYKKRNRTVKTTVDLPESLWRAARIRAIDERTNLRRVVIKALEAYLRTRPGRGSSR